MLKKTNSRNTAKYTSSLTHPYDETGRIFLGAPSLLKEEEEGVLPLLYHKENKAINLPLTLFLLTSAPFSSRYWAISLWPL